MKPSYAIELHRDAVREAAKRHKAANPRVFGSALHGADAENSDLDILVDALPEATLFDLGGLQAEVVWQTVATALPELIQQLTATRDGNV